MIHSTDAIKPSHIALPSQRALRVYGDRFLQGAGGVAVVGAGNVGSAVANALVLLGATDRVVLYDRRLARAEGEAWDIADGAPLLRNVDVVATDDWQATRLMR